MIATALFSGAYLMFLGVILMSEVIQQLGYASHRAAWVMIRALLFGCPAAIFTYLGFARMTNLAEVLVVSFLCIVMTCLSWLAGHVMLLMVTDN